MRQIHTALVVLLLTAAAASAQTLKIYQIDVEQADAALIVAPNGRTLLIDSGEKGMGQRIKDVMMTAEDVTAVREAFRAEAPDHIDQLVGTFSMGMRHLGPTEWLRFITGDLMLRDPFPPSDSDVLGEVARAIAFIERPTFRLRAYAPLQNFSSEGNFEIAMPHGLCIRPMTDEELTFIHGGPGWRGLPVGFHELAGWACVAEVEETKRLGAQTAWSHEDYHSFTKRLERAVLGLRTFKPGAVGFQAVHLNARAFSPVGGIVVRTLIHEFVPWGEFKIAIGEVNDLTAHLAHFAETLHPSLEVAASRLSFASLRTNPRDRILDAVIGLEAILLAQIGAQDRGENRFRLSMNYAVLQPAHQRRSSYKIARNLYDLRSAIAHGGDVGEAGHLLGDEKVSLGQVADRAREMLRLVLGQFVAGGKKPAYLTPGFWEQHYFDDIELLDVHKS